MSITGDPWAEGQARTERDLRRSERVLFACFALSVGLVAAVAIPGFLAAKDRASAERERWTVVSGTVLDGRGIAPDTSELLVRYPQPDGTATQRWMPIQSFAVAEVGMVYDVAYPKGQPEAALLKEECSCIPSAVPIQAVPIAMVMAGMSIVVGRGYVGRREIDPSKLPPPVGVRVWWAGPRSAMLRIHEPIAPPGSGRSAGMLLATASLPYSYRNVIRDGDVLGLSGPLKPGGRVVLATASGALRRPIRLGKPTLAKRSTGWDRYQSQMMWIANLGRSNEPLGPEESRRADLAESVRTGLGPLIVLIWALTLPPPWGFAVILGFVPLLASVAVMVWTRLGSEPDLDQRAAQAAMGMVEAPAPPEPPAPAGTAGSAVAEIFPSLAGDRRAPSETGRFLGVGLTIAILAIPVISAFIVAPGLLLPVLAAAVIMRTRSPRFVEARYRRPALPLWLGVFLLGASSVAYQAAFDTSAWGEPTSVRILAGLLVVPACWLAIRLATVGMTVARDEVVVRNVLATIRLSSGDVTEIGRRPKRGVTPPAGLLLHRRNADPVVVGRFAVSAPVAKVAVRDFDRGAICGLAAGTVGTAGWPSPAQQPGLATLPPPPPVSMGPYGRTF